MNIEPPKLLHRLKLATIGSCTCLTKTPEAEHHKELCRYRVLVEAHALISLLTQPIELVENIE